MTSSRSFEELTRSNRTTRQNAVRDIGRHAGGTVLQKRFGCVAERAAGIDDVVDQDASPCR